MNPKEYNHNQFSTMIDLESSLKNNTENWIWPELLYLRYDSFCSMELNVVFLCKATFDFWSHFKLLSRGVFSQTKSIVIAKLKFLFWQKKQKSLFYFIYFSKDSDSVHPIITEHHHLCRKQYIHQISLLEEELVFLEQDHSAPCWGPASLPACPCGLRGNLNHMLAEWHAHTHNAFGKLLLFANEAKVSWSEG